MDSATFQNPEVKESRFWSLSDRREGQGISGASAGVAGPLAWLCFRLTGHRVGTERTLGPDKHSVSWWCQWKSGWHGLGRDCEVGVSKQNF